MKLTHRLKGTFSEKRRQCYHEAFLHVDADIASAKTELDKAEDAK